MTDFPPEPPPSWPSMRDRIEAALADLNWLELASLEATTSADRHILAGTLRKAFAPQLATMREQAATIERVRAVVRRHRHDETIPKREIEAALYGDDSIERMIETMTDIAAFLNARLGEDDAVAEGMKRATLSITYQDRIGPAFHDRFTPDALIADIAAKRKLLGAHRVDKKGRCKTCARWTTDTTDDGHKLDRVAYEGVEAPCLTRRLLALPFADHPDYQEAWRP